MAVHPVELTVESRWPVVAWGPRWLSCKTRHLIHSLCPSTLDMMSNFLRFLPEIRWGSSCSGTESPAWCLTEFSNVLRDVGPVPHIKTIFSAELVAEKRAFIEACSPLPTEQMYQDMHVLTRAEAALECVSGRPRVPDLSRLFLFAAGFSCKTVSGLATATLDADKCLDEGSGQTGETFTATCGIVEIARPVIIILENVMGLKRGDQHVKVMQKLSARGYAVKCIELCSSEFSLPQDRYRLWFIAIRLDKLERAGWSPDTWSADVDELYARVRSYKTHSITPLESFLLPEDDTELERLNADILAKSDSGELSGSLGPGGAPMSGSVSSGLKARNEEINGVRSAWTPSLERCYPQFLKLSEREKSILDEHRVTFPDVDFCFVLSVG